MTDALEAAWRRGPGDAVACLVHASLDQAVQITESFPFAVTAG